jgi:hypothetical protein
MKKYIQPTTKSMRYSSGEIALIISDRPGYGDGMTNEGTFENEGALPQTKSVWD